MAPLSPNFVRTAVNVVRRLYPEALAEGFDNTGLLLDAVYNEAQKPLILLTIDVTKAVVDEAIRLKSSLIIAYHPLIFRGLKSLTQKDTQQESLLRLAREGISVYSPHTAIDAAPGGVNDWLASTISNGEEASRKIIKSSSAAEAAGVPEAGPGRIVKLAAPMSLSKAIENFKKSTGLPNTNVALPQALHNNWFDKTVSTYAVCAGSGGGLFSEMKSEDKEDVDLYVTGEMSHHEALHLIEKGKVVIAGGHSNTERGFLKASLKEQLEREIGKETEVEVVVSEVDKDPYVIV
ncbi:NGG1p interacting factor 3 [Ascobolus immersus RN42]|uniref:NGG1p interacting factor 3 n=1 Tax=Ascobolus immersus RN42 TaxID=1160509 RepID=A0A3N4I4R7_ASCIM|nr:NGG1p interacting factor 3 [Ascobolus immersus RN42]